MKVRAATGAGFRPARVRIAARAELIKLGAQPTLQLLALVVIVAPVAFAGLLSSQSGAPSDALLGNWVHTSGLSLSLVLLSFAGNWGAPIIAGLLAGDLFAAEDRLRTWPTLLGRETSLAELFAGKLVAGALVALGLGLGLALASLAGGLLFVGAQGLPNLSGQPWSGGHLLALTLVAWLLTLLPLLGFTAVTALASVLTRNAIAGVLAPVLLGLIDQLLGLTGDGTWLHAILLSSGFTAWAGLVDAHPYLGPAVIAELAALAWISVPVWLAWRSLSRREFVPAPAAPHARTPARGRLARAVAPARGIAVAVIGLALLALATSVGPTGVTEPRLTAALRTTFRNLTILQQDEIGHAIPAGSRFTIIPLCNKRGQRPVGPGDWDCTVHVYVLLPASRQPLSDTPVDYDVSVASDGCFKAAAPAAVVGGTTLDDHGRRVLNPLSVIYGCFNVL